MRSGEEKLHEESKGPRKMLEKLKSLPNKIRNPTDPRNGSKKGGYSVWTVYNRGRRGDSATKTLDSTFATKADANQRVRYLFYIKDRPWDCDAGFGDGADVEDLLDEDDSDSYEKEIDGMIKIVFDDESYGSSHTYAVVPTAANDFIFDECQRSATTYNSYFTNDEEAPEPPDWKKMLKAPARIRNPPAANKAEPAAKGFVVWSSCGYGYDGWHSYDGPPARKFDSSYDKIEDANARARHNFFVDNPWGFDKNSEEGDFHGHSKTVTKGAEEYCIHPDDSEIWSVGVVPKVVFDHIYLIDD